MTKTVRNIHSIPLLFGYRKDELAIHLCRLTVCLYWPSITWDRAKGVYAFITKAVAIVHTKPTWKWSWAIGLEVVLGFGVAWDHCDNPFRKAWTEGAVERIKTDLEFTVEQRGWSRWFRRVYS